MNWSIGLDYVMLGINLGRSDEENHGVLKSLMTGQ
jgi:hypothetical protein